MHKIIFLQKKNHSLQVLTLHSFFKVDHIIVDEVNQLGDHQFLIRQRNMPLIKGTWLIRNYQEKLVLEILAWISTLLRRFLWNSREIRFIIMQFNYQIILKKNERLMYHKDVHLQGLYKEIEAKHGWPHYKEQEGSERKLKLDKLNTKCLFFMFMLHWICSSCK